MYFNILNSFSICILTVPFHICDISSRYFIFLLLSASLKMAQKDRNMYEDDHIFVYYCIQLKSSFCKVDIIFVAILCLLLQGGWDGVVGITTGYWLDGPGIESRRGKCCLHGFQNGPGNHPASCTMGTGSLSRG